MNHSGCDNRDSLNVDVSTMWILTFEVYLLATFSFAPTPHFLTFTFHHLQFLSLVLLVLDLYRVFHQFVSKNM